MTTSCTSAVERHAGEDEAAILLLAVADHVVQRHVAAVVFERLIAFRE